MERPVVFVLALLFLSGCAANTLSGFGGASEPAQPTGQDPEQTIGGIVGGGLIMGQIGSDLPVRARLAGINAEYNALESTPAGEPVTWRGERGHSGTVTAAQPYRVGSQDCRPYGHVVNAAGTTRSARGTACRNPDGSWTLLN